MTIYTKKQSISDLKDGDVVNDIFVVKIKKGVASYAKGYRFNLLLSDNTGKTIEYVYWGSSDESKVSSLYGSIAPDAVVNVQGKISIYNGKLQLATNEPMTITVLKDDEYIKGDFVKPQKKDIEELYAQLREKINLVNNPDIKKLLESIFYDTDIEKKFKTHPGAIEIHHNWVGGLLEHTLEIMDYCETSLKHHPSLDRDVLTAGALLHDIGKLEELEVTSRIKGTDKGQLVGHLILGVVYVTNKIDEIPGFDETLKNKILHMLVSHHGKIEYGSPKEPMFPEAMILYYADEMSSKMAEMVEFLEHSKSETEDGFMYSKRSGRNIYLR
ncbi:MAG: 3'-5' exoribonuclease YhaM family protein [Candidatus Woesearchaeota archaeon]